MQNSLERNAEMSIYLGDFYYKTGSSAATILILTEIPLYMGNVLGVKLKKV